MSVDWTVVCDQCETYRHLGQDMGGQCTFGYGSQDKEGCVNAGEFIARHLFHHFRDGEHLRIVLTDQIPVGYQNEEGR